MMMRPVLFVWLVFQVVAQCQEEKGSVTPSQETSDSDNLQPNLQDEKSYITGYGGFQTESQREPAHGPNPGSGEPAVKSSLEEATKTQTNVFSTTEVNPELEALDNKRATDKVKGPNPGSYEPKVYNLNQENEESKNESATEKSNLADPRKKRSDNINLGPNQPAVYHYNQEKEKPQSNPGTSTEHLQGPEDPLKNLAVKVHGPNPGPDQPEVITPTGVVVNQENQETPTISTNTAQPQTESDEAMADHSAEKLKGPNPGTNSGNKDPQYKDTIKTGLPNIGIYTLF